MKPDRHGRRMRAASAAVVSAVLTLGCGRPEAKASRVVVRNPEYLVVRPIRREADAEHTLRVELPHAGGGYGFASATPLLDLSSFDVAAASFAGGRTSIVGEATIWLPLTAEGSHRLAAWSNSPGEHRLGIFLKGELVAAPQIKGAIGGGIPLPVAGKAQGDRVLKELRNGGVAESQAPR